ncbi:aspartyl/asparaginyl beta-hydroxylase domain-containing protein [Croceicoccus estronivorus]|uniref:aspartyl/asparaginyl beta-hydroxylase domain-containing protein n=1 Tax=Croceicoccus estronivorus TaxID=1172626 RepID=UPI0014795FB3|nr:aspartyl/asparaginyl beta-hydroxylase domain-containing protein [Croceicoccus estronivorus]
MIADTPFVDPAAIEGLGDLQRHWRVIQTEAMHLIDTREVIPPLGEISPDHRRIARTAAWKSFFFQGYGFRSDANCARCPHTAELIDRVPGVVVAFFSIMEPGTHVPLHRGLTKAWLNCHLPLMVPDSDKRCEIEVAGTGAQWREGKWLVFDETYPHEVWNDTDQLRVVLFLQVRRPMRPAGRLASQLIYQGVRMSSFVQDARRAIGAR